MIDLPSSAAAPFWAKPRFVLLAILAYLAIHFAVRMAMWPTLGIDDAEQALFAQQFAWSYRDPAPPLFTWLLLSLGTLLPIDIVAISLIRYALLAVVFVFTYLTARRLIVDPRLSALSVYSFAAIYVFAFYSHHDLTHTTALSAMLALAWYAFVRLCERLSLRRYLALGGIFGLGLLAKWNFVMFAAALPLACLLLPKYRSLVLTWKVVPAAIVCGAIVLPTALAALYLGPVDQETVGSVLVGEPGSHFRNMAEGTGRLLLSVIAYPQPFLPLAVIFFGLPLWRGLRSQGSGTTDSSRRLDVNLILVTIAISLALHLALVTILGARQFSERLMQPPLFILPILVFMLIERGPPSAHAATLYATALAVLVLGTLGARIVVYQLGADHCGTCRAMVPFDALASDLRAAGFSGEGTIVADGFHVGGNMRVEFPDARIIDATYPPAMWPAPTGEGQCLLVWRQRDDGGSGARQYPESYLAASLNGDTTATPRDGVASALMFHSDTKRYHLGYRLYDRPVGDCR